jgi:predicted metal-dependent phosphoesterase TrpH
VPGADLHVHSTASDGEFDPAEVVRRAAAVGLDTIALTDHDTLDGVAAAVIAGTRHGVRVIAGCEFSVAMPWGEMHLLAYFLPQGDAPLDDFLATQRGSRRARLDEMVRRLRASGVVVERDQVLALVGGAVGRPHVAKALVKLGVVKDVNEAFERFLGAGRTAYVPKRLPALATVTRLVRDAGGVTSAAHLKDRISAAVCDMLRSAGVDGIEVLHPSHDSAVVQRATDITQRMGLLATGGTDWHGDIAAAHGRVPLGALRASADWVAALEQAHIRRVEQHEAVS